MLKKMSDVILICLWSQFGVIGAVVDEKLVSVSVYEEESVTLHTDTKILKDERMYWRFRDKDKAILLIEIIQYKVTYYGFTDERFKDRLQISDTLTGDLTVKNMRIKHTGQYDAEIQTGTGTSKKRFNVTVKVCPRVDDAGSNGSFSVKEGESVTLHTDIQAQTDDLILWRFGDKNVLIAKCDMEDNKISYDDDDGRFRDRLKMNNQTGDLTITNIINLNTGVYKLKIISNRETKYKTFSVSVSGGGVVIQLWLQLAVLAVTGVASVAAVIVLCYDIKSRRDQQKRKQTTTTSDD
ncbi:uncharacterized protein [Misgurnus anguillicaudatus]|uniref:uncharacterized protein n=1 Tax=Misgurnus anguillicaudatus TaxID=75329 RepID=UPI003CCF3238